MPRSQGRPELTFTTDRSKLKWKMGQLLEQLQDNPTDYLKWKELNEIVELGVYASASTRELIHSGIYTCMWEFYHYFPPDPRRVGIDAPCKAEEFHTSLAKIRGAFGGNRSGKTVIEVAEYLMACLGSTRYNNYWKERVPVHVRLNCPDFPNSVMKAIVPVVDMLMPPKAARAKKNQLGYIHAYEFVNGSLWELMTYEQKVLKHASVKLDMTGFDEPPPKNIYDEEGSRIVDKNGRIVMGMTPIKQDGGYPIGWIYNDVYEEALKPENKKKYFCVDIDIEDNRLSRGGYLPDEAVDSKIKDWEKDEETYQARKSGKFTHLLGLVFKDLDPAVHLCDEFDVSDRNEFTLYSATDPHPRQPISSMYLAAGKDGNFYFYDELAMTETTVPEYCNEMKKKENITGRVNFRMMDESADADNQLTKSNTLKDFKKNGIKCRKGSNRAMYITGIPKLKEYLKPIHDNLTGFERPRLYIFKRCVNFWWQLRHYVWSENATARSRENKNAPEKPKKKADHLVNCGLYLASISPRFVNYAKEEAETQYNPFFSKTGY